MGRIVTLYFSSWAETHSAVKVQVVNEALGDIMIENNDWRLMNEIEHLYNQEVDPTDGEELIEHLPNLKKCVFCLDMVEAEICQKWYLPLDQSCCICEKCFDDFKDMFRWRLLDGWDIDWKSD